MFDRVPSINTSKQSTENTTSSVLQKKDSTPGPTHSIGQLSAPIQMAGGTTHHDPRKKSHMNSQQGQGQVNASAVALGHIQQGVSRKEARRMANAQLGQTARGKKKNK